MKFPGVKIRENLFTESRVDTGIRQTDMSNIIGEFLRTALGTRQTAFTHEKIFTEEAVPKMQQGKAEKKPSFCHFRELLF
jgi:hypothetical protein